MKVYIVGVGLGKEELLTAKAKQIIQKADMVLTTERLQKQFSHLNINSICMSITDIVQKVIENKDSQSKICVLASGDVGFYSIANTLKTRISDVQLEFVSGISSLQYLTSHMQIPYDDVKIMSMHGRENTVVPYVCYNKRVFVLTGGKYKVNHIINQLVDSGLSQVYVTIGENLSDEQERIVSGKAIDFVGVEFDNLAVMLIENSAFVKHYEVIMDEEFIRGKSPMTKECVRTISVSKLQIRPSDVVYDIGAGTGSVSIAMARNTYEGMVYAVEKEEYATELIEQNKMKFGAFNVSVVQGVAPDKMEELPPADKVFIGGSTGNLEEILDMIYSKNEKAIIVVNAVTIETLAQSVDLFKKKSIEAEITCINVSDAQKFGNYNLMKAQNPVYVIKGQKCI